MINLSCIIIEDEPVSQEILKKYIGDFPGLKLLAVCKNAIEGYDQLKLHTVDVIFLDIAMPKLSGLEFYRTLQNPPPVIFTTAYPEYAVNGFEVNAIDYLVKPFSFERFVKAVNKLAEAKTQLTEKDSFIFLTADKKIHKVNIDEILFAEAFGDYVRVHTNEKTLVVHQTLQKFQDLLTPKNFLRIHKSFIIAVAKIDYIEGNRLFIAKKEIPIGQTYKNDVMNALQMRNR